MSNLLAPVARQRTFTDLGVVAPGALLYTFVSGTPATPLATTSDAAGTVPNTNPIVASAGGLFGPIYLTPGTAYHFRLTDAAGVLIWDQDPVTAFGGGVLSVSGGGTGQTALAPAYGVLTAGPTPPGAVQIVPPGTLGWLFASGGAAALPQWTVNPTIVVALPGSGVFTFDAAAGTLFTIQASADCAITAPQHPTEGQRVTLRFYASGGARTLSLFNWSSGANPGAFRFNGAPSALTPTPLNTTDYIECRYFDAFQCWDVIAYVKGFAA